MSIFKKQRKLQDDGQLLEALNFVLTGPQAKQLTWISLGVAGYTHWLKNNGTLSPDKDFKFIQEFMPKFWDVYRSAALKALDAPALKSSEVTELVDEMQILIREFPTEYRGESLEEKELLLYLCSCLQSLEALGKVELSNATVHALLFLWAHSRIK